MASDQKQPKRSLKRTEISLTPIALIERQKQVGLRIAFAKLEDGGEGNEEHYIQDEVEMKVKVPFEQHSLGLASFVERTDTNSDSSNVQLTEVINKLLNEVHLMRLEAVAITWLN